MQTHRRPLFTSLLVGEIVLTEAYQGGYRLPFILTFGGNLYFGIFIDAESEEQHHTFRVDLLALIAHSNVAAKLLR